VKQAVKMTGLSCHHFRSSGVWLALSLLACHLDDRFNLFRTDRAWLSSTVPPVANGTLDGS
jgi:hypothetical protein